MYIVGEINVRNYFICFDIIFYYDVQENPLLNAIRQGMTGYFSGEFYETEDFIDDTFLLINFLTEAIVFKLFRGLFN